MMDYFGTTPAQNDTAASSLDLSMSEIATSIAPVLIGMAVVGIVALLMLL